MSMGMMMLPPVLISLPFKLLLFVMVDGWGLIVTVARHELPLRPSAMTWTTDAVIHIALQTMILAAKLAGPILVVEPRRRLRRVAVPVGHADPGGHALLRAQADRGRPGHPAHPATGCSARPWTSPTTCSTRCPSCWPTDAAVP